jgi:UDP-2,3-diacylglucosamine hydrolase
MQLLPGKKVYFLSDFHLGVPDAQSSLAREKKIVRFLDEASRDAAVIFIVGDLFDFWYEYRKVVPKGFVRILGKLAELTDAGIPIHFFVGNHDMWMQGYFEQELNIPVYFEPKSFSFNGQRFLIGHGDGLGPGDHGYKFLKKIFRNRIAQWLFGIIPPAIGMGLAHVSSKSSRAATGTKDDQFLGEWLIQFCRTVLKTDRYDYFIFGHRHLPIDYDLGGGSRYINLGDWIRYDTYAVYDGQTLALKAYTP